MKYVSTSRGNDDNNTERLRKNRKRNQLFKPIEEKSTSPQKIKQNKSNKENRISFLGWKVIFFGREYKKRKTYQYRMEIDAVQVEPFHSIQITHFGHGWNESSVSIEK